MEVKLRQDKDGVFLEKAVTNSVRSFWEAL